MSGELRRLARVPRRVAARALSSSTVRQLAPRGRRAARVAAAQYVDAVRADRARSNSGYRASTPDDVLSSAYVDLVRAIAVDRSFVDVGCMWRVHGAVAFLAEEAGATRVTAYDLYPDTPEFRATHAARSSSVRYVRGNLSQRPLSEDVGPHEVVWCTGVLYHTPDPFAMVQELTRAAERLLVLGTKAIPEIPGFAQAAVFYPGMPDEDRRGVWGQVWGEGVGKPFGKMGLLESEWWWGLSPSATAAMVAAQPGWRVRETIEVPFSGADDNLFVVGERVG